MKPKVLCFFGTRPEAIKMAPVIMALKKEKSLSVKVVVSSQHQGMLDQVLDLFKIKPDHDLNVMKKSQSLFDVTTLVLERFRDVLLREKPDLVLVHGDTTTAFAGALASFYLRIPVGHVEAGLRTKDISSPFPEEANRRLIDSLSTLHFAPTPESRNNLLNENHLEERIFVTGNTVIDALLSVESKPIQNLATKTVLRKIGEKRFILLTAHRRENFGWKIEEIFKTVNLLSLFYPETHWIFPVHPNPHVSESAQRILSNKENIHLLPPLDYGDFIGLMKRCCLIVTDSGGMQEEAAYLGKRLLILRDETERPEANAQLIGTKPRTIFKEVGRFLRQRQRELKRNLCFGDGKAAVRISREIVPYLFS